jgi:small subunit ribosomal protein S6
LPLYECVFIARQDISAPQVDAIADHVTKVIEEQGGSVAKREYWGLRSLAYRIRKNRKGHYVLLNVDAPPAAVEEVGRQLRINEDVMRHLTIRVEALNEGPSQVMLSRSSRDDRDRPRDRGGRDRDDRDRRDRDRGDRDERGGREREGRGRFGDDDSRPAEGEARPAGRDSQWER